MTEKLTPAFPNPLCLGGRFPSTSDVLTGLGAVVDMSSENDEACERKQTRPKNLDEEFRPKNDDF